MIYTSYYANRKIPEDFVKVAISRKTLVNRWCTQLMPSWELLDNYKNNPKNLSQEQLEQEYTTKFMSQLEKEDLQLVLTILQNITNNAENIVLLCYEKTGKFCHRNLVAKWLRDNGIPCEEY